ncbi:unnamed protein product [Onchocerca flexuosa]|uniref:Secreted protein n=1 Tax=Onchocerca flexuosa TaxID=387005 RepID=A0A183HXE1_9BILA|nr:unnamed protein product [Onchocerca flexuosa]
MLPVGSMLVKLVFPSFFIDWNRNAVHNKMCCFLKFTIRLIEPKQTGFNSCLQYAKTVQAVLADGTTVVRIASSLNLICIFEPANKFLAQRIWGMTASCENFNDLENVLEKVMKIYQQFIFLLRNICFAFINFQFLLLY